MNLSAPHFPHGSPRSCGTSTPRAATCPPTAPIAPRPSTPTRRTCDATLAPRGSPRPRCADCGGAISAASPGWTSNSDGSSQRSRTPGSPRRPTSSTPRITGRCSASSACGGSARCTRTPPACPSSPRAPRSPGDCGCRRPSPSWTPRRPSFTHRRAAPGDWQAGRPDHPGGDDGRVVFSDCHGRARSGAFMRRGRWKYIHYGRAAPAVRHGADPDETEDSRYPPDVVDDLCLACHHLRPGPRNRRAHAFVRAQLRPWPPAGRTHERGRVPRTAAATAGAPAGGRRPAACSSTGPARSSAATSGP